MGPDQIEAAQPTLQIVVRFCLIFVSGSLLTQLYFGGHQSVRTEGTKGLAVGLW